MAQFNMGSTSLAVFPIYIYTHTPPKGLAASMLCTITKRMLQWVEQETDKLGHSCLPIVAGDFHCSFGWQADTTGRRFKVETPSVRIREPAIESKTSTTVHDFPASNYLALAD
eukprot:7226790-Pyramimonas_sp.AAC.1